VTAFSEGTTVLLRNSDKIKKILKNYALTQKLPNLMLFNEYGLSFSAYINPAFEIPNYTTRQSIEILGLQLINIFKKSHSKLFSKELTNISIQLRENLYAILIKTRSLEPFYIFYCSESQYDTKANEFIKNMVKDLSETLVN
jgi:hypothetical protein